MPLRITASVDAAPKFKSNFDGLRSRFEASLATAVNMAASMIKQKGDADIAQAGNFGDRWTSGLHVEPSTALGNMRISMTHDVEYAGIFESGGTIEGHPLLWIPLSFTDAAGVPARDYPGGLFSVTRRGGGAPLLFSMVDRQPKYFGIASVTIPKKFHLEEITNEVMADFRNIFADAFKG